LEKTETWRELALIVARSDVLLIFLASDVLLGFGPGFANTAQANCDLEHTPQELAGSSSAVNNAGQTLGNSFGIALLNLG
jgi:hypothetical protein